MYNVTQRKGLKPWIDSIWISTGQVYLSPGARALYLPISMIIQLIEGNRAQARASGRSIVRGKRHKEGRQAE